jgi:hypothetical protein
VHLFEAILEANNRAVAGDQRVLALFAVTA